SITKGATKTVHFGWVARAPCGVADYPQYRKKLMCPGPSRIKGVVEARRQRTRGFMQQVRAASRRKYTPEEKARIVLEGFRREVAVNELRRREGIKPGAYYSWTKDFMEAGKERLTRDTVMDATRDEINELKRESTDLKQLVADLSLEVYRLKKTAIPPLEDRNGAGK
ncbi:transposase, partial [Chloroflexota bacterium]